MVSASQSIAVKPAKDKLIQLATAHPCWSHPLFERLSQVALTQAGVARLLRNYDAHASVLRRLLLKAATVMPEPAVGFVLENVRNEYGNGDYELNHQAQLQDVAWQAGVSKQLYKSAKIEAGVKQFCKTAPKFYSAKPDVLGAEPRHHSKMLRAAVTAGAITATELLAIREFEYLQKAFTSIGLEHHIWFHHVTIEAEHLDESLGLALYFIERYNVADAVQFGMQGILDANIDLYDGLLMSLSHE